MFRGAPWRCWIRDLSLGGAGLEPALPAMLGQVVELTCPSFDFAGALPGRVVNVADRRTCMAFDLDGERLDDFGPLPGRQHRNRLNKTAASGRSAAAGRSPAQAAEQNPALSPPAVTRANPTRSQLHQN